MLFSHKIYSFHIPLFFFLSGYVFSVKKYNNFKEFLISKIKSLIIPLVSFSIFIFIYDLIVKYLLLDKIDLKTILFEPIGLFTQIRGTYLGGSLWFLTCLFVCEVAFYFIIKITKNNEKLIAYTLLLSSIVGYLYFKFINILTPWAIDAAFTAIVFLGIGYLFKRKSNIIEALSKVGYIPIFIVINIVSAYFNYKISGYMTDLYACKLGNYFLYYISAISGIIMCILIFKKVKEIKLLTNIGKNSLIYYCLHGSLFMVMEILVGKMLSFCNKNYIYELIYGLLMVIIVAVCIWFISKLINNKMGFVLGKSKQK